MLISMFLLMSGFAKLTTDGSIILKNKEIIKRSACTSSSFVCNNGECVARYTRCDGVADCSDRSDETRALCFNFVCPKFSFKCAYGACIDADKTCDGNQDCIDGSDELLKDCSNKNPQTPVSLSTPTGNNCARTHDFQCRNGECIERTNVCDGLRNCRDGSDETVTECYKEGFMCPRGSFRCNYGACVDGDARCDQKVDCADGSDEYDCSTSPNQPTPVTQTSIARPTTRFTTTTWRTTFRQPPRWSTTQRPTTVNFVNQNAIPHNSCPFPDDKPGTIFRLSSCNCTKAFVPSTDILVMDCTNGYVPLMENNYFWACINGALSPPKQGCVRSCKPLFESPSVKYSCTYEGSEQSCENPARPGAKVSFSCAGGYFNSRSSQGQGKCTENGVWENVDEFDCRIDCGKLFKNTLVPTIANGSSVSNISEYPWHAGIYSKINDLWMQDCGGTIISDFFILTAAHCVHRGNVRYRPSQIKIAVGKYFRDFYTPESTSYTLDVAEIHVPDSFQGWQQKYENDLSIIQVSSVIRFTEVVRPACIILNEESHSLIGQIGHVVGWGKDGAGLNTEVLTSARLPYISNAECRGYSKAEEKLAPDKFCAFLTNGTRVLQGDSGGGLTFEFNDRFYVYGIVSVNINGTDISAFTDLSNERNRQFIHAVKRNFDIMQKLNNRNRG